MRRYIGSVKNTANCYMRKAMKFRLHQDLGQSAIREIGNYLRTYGSGHHWIERFHGEVFINPGDEIDARILRNEFSSMVDLIEGSDRDESP